jgi:hypothetical protein
MRAAVRGAGGRRARAACARTSPSPSPAGTSMVPGRGRHSTRARRSRSAGHRPEEFPSWAEVLSTDRSRPTRMRAGLAPAEAGGREDLAWPGDVKPCRLHRSWRCRMRWRRGSSGSRAARACCGPSPARVGVANALAAASLPGLLAGLSEAQAAGLLEGLALAGIEPVGGRGPRRSPRGWCARPRPPTRRPERPRPASGLHGHHGTRPRSPGGAGRSQVGGLRPRWAGARLNGSPSVLAGACGSRRAGSRVRLLRRLTFEVRATPGPDRPWRSAEL